MDFLDLFERPHSKMIPNPRAVINLVITQCKDTTSPEGLTDRIMIALYQIMEDHKLKIERADKKLLSFKEDAVDR